MTIKYGWTKNVLIHHIENRSYEKYLLDQTNFDQVVPEKYRLQAKMAVKDEYIFDFLEMGDVSTYTLTSRLPDRFAGLLPTQEEIQERLGSLLDHFENYYPIS